MEFPTRHQERRNKRAFSKAKREAEQSDGMVCGYVDTDGVPHYFVASRDTSEDEIRSRAFQLLHGRPMNRAEALLDAARRGEFLHLADQVLQNYLEGKETVDAGD